MTDTEAKETALQWFGMRLARLEEERGFIAADIASLRTELRTRFDSLEKRLDRIEDKLDERPSRAELVGRTSRGPEVTVRGPFGLFAHLRRVNGGILVLFFAFVFIVVLVWLRSR